MFFFQLRYLCGHHFAVGTTALHNDLEECVARFIGKPAAIVFGMGYATNSCILPVLIGKVCVIHFVSWFYGKQSTCLWIWLVYHFCLQGGLIISDSLNHNSIVNGARGSGASIRVFQHNSEFFISFFFFTMEIINVIRFLVVYLVRACLKKWSWNAPSTVNASWNSSFPFHAAPAHLEEVLREQIAEGQPRTHRPWKKIIVIVEGIYSMEGELCKLPEIIAICKKYKVAFTWLLFF